MSDSNEAARKRWDQLSIPKKHELIRQVVDTRSEELRLAYRAILGIGIGVKSDARTRKEPRLLFLVKRKLAESTLARGKTDERRRLPEYIHHYATHLYSIPTGVEECHGRVVEIQNTVKLAAGHCVGRAQTTNRVSGTATPTCIVTVNRKTPKYIVGCLHAWGKTDINLYAPSVNESAIGVSSGYSGIVIGAESKISQLDVALIEVTELATAKKSLGNVLPLAQSPKPYKGDFRKHTSVERMYTLHRPDGSKRILKHNSDWNNFKVPRNTFFKGLSLAEYLGPIMLFDFHGGNPTIAGDSGSPVTFIDGVNNKLTFLGMHIGLLREVGRRPMSIVIPWEEMKNTKRYTGIMNDNNARIDWYFP